MREQGLTLSPAGSKIKLKDFIDAFPTLFKSRYLKQSNGFLLSLRRIQDHEWMSLEREILNCLIEGFASPGHKSTVDEIEVSKRITTEIRNTILGAKSSSSHQHGGSYSSSNSSMDSYPPKPQTKNDGILQNPKYEKGILDGDNIPASPIIPGSAPPKISSSSSLKDDLITGSDQMQFILFQQYEEQQLLMFQQLLETKELQNRHYQQRIDLDKKHSALFDAFYEKQTQAMASSIASLSKQSIPSALGDLISKETSALSSTQNTEANIEKQVEELKNIKDKIDEVERYIRDKKQNLLNSHKFLKESLERAQKKQVRLGNDLGNL